MSEQNVYDESTFFNGYKKLRDDPSNFNVTFEQPVLYGLLPTLKNKRVCDLGCGFGDCCRYIASLGAKHVTGVDISANMLKLAIAKTKSQRISYVQESVEQFDYTGEPLDVVVSSFTFHYVKDIKTVFHRINRWLKKRGIFVFSVDHPIMTANPSWRIIDQNGIPTWALVNYRDERQVLQNWFVDGVQKYHHKIETYVNNLIDVNFSIETLIEPIPSDQLIEANQALAIHKVRPPLLVIKAKKN